MTKWGFDRAELALFVRALGLLLGDLEHEAKSHTRDETRKERMKIRHLLGKIRAEVKWRDTA